MKERFIKTPRFSKKSQELLTKALRVIEENAAEGDILTLRELYYALVGKGLIPNSTTEYARLGDLLVKARMAGIVDWEAIEDRIRVPYLPYWEKDFSSALDNLVAYYRLNRQEGQENYIEVVIEKDALSGKLKPITSHYHIYLTVNRGYASCTAIYDMANRLHEAEKRGQNKIILYIGDHDPSGLDMLRDIEERLREFGIEAEVIPVALTWEQIQERNLPPNPAKIKDPRAKWYIQKYGQISWEVDALPPKVLRQLITSAIEENIDMELFEKVVEQESRDKKRLAEIAKKGQKK